MSFPLPGDPSWQTPKWKTWDSGPSEIVYAQMGQEIPRMPWDKFVGQVLDWRAGEHFALIGPTGQGKTTMLLNLLPLHKYTVVCATKPHDASMDALLETGYDKFERWQSLPPKKYPRRVLWPDARSIDSKELQQRVFADAMAKIYREGGWTFAIDELWWFVNILGLQEEIRIFLLQGRALGLSFVGATQRPKFVPLEIYDQSTHLMFWRDNDEENLSRLSRINVKSAKLIKEVVANLRRFQVLYINTRTGAMCRTTAPPPLRGGN